MIITLCGSARFERQFHLWNEILTLSGHTVFSLAVFPSQKQGRKDWYTKEEKIALDQAHLEKIRASDAILVLNTFGYLGESTMREIEFAKANDKLMFALESWGQGKGIGSMHTHKKQLAAAENKVLGIMSPIDTMECTGFKYWGDLLPPAGTKRSNLVEKINEFREQYEGSED